MFLEATASAQYPVGVITSIVDTFINDGTTTEYMTQHIGTVVDDVYAKIQTTSSREYYRIDPTASNNYNAPVRPTGLIGSSTSVEINGPASTYYTVEEYRTYLDGHYAHLVSSISNVVTDPGAVAPTPKFEFDGSLNSARLEVDSELQESLLHSYSLGLRPQHRVHTSTVGRIVVYEETDLEVDELENEIGDFDLSASPKRPRQIDPEDLVAIESEANEVVVDPSKPSQQSLPTFTVDANGQLNFPTPSIEAVNPVVELKSAERQHRFLPPQETAKSALDTVTYVGFVDFTTTIDDTVVIFRPKNTFNTKSTQVFQQRIEPTSAFTRSHVFPTHTEEVRTSEESVFRPQAENEIDAPEVAEKESLVGEEEEDDVRKQTSGINALKSLLSSSAALRSSVRSTNTRSRFISPSSVLSPSVVSPSQEIVASLEPELESATDSNLVDIIPSIESDVELVFKTVYTTYTYLTTFFKGNSTRRVQSREEVESNVITFTNILKSSDLPSISSSCELDTTCQFSSTDSLNLNDFTEGFIGRPDARTVEEQPRSGEDGRKVEFFNVENSIPSALKTAYTTYTYYVTSHNGDSSTVSTKTEVYSNVISESSINLGLSEESTSILPTSTAEINLRAESSLFQAQSSVISKFPIRRLEVSSIRNRQLHSELTTPETAPSTTDAQETTASDLDLEIAATKPTSLTSEEEAKTTPEDTEEEEATTSAATPALTEEVTEVTTETTESAEDIAVDEVGIIPKTLYTTFTFFTTLFQNGTSSVTSNLDTVTNVITDSNIQPTTVEPSVTFYTTFTFWTTIVDETNNSSLIISSEQTVTDILPLSTSILTPDEVVSGGLDINPTAPVNSFIEQTVFSLPTSSIEEDIESSSSIVPTVQSSEEEEDSKSRSESFTVSGFTSVSSSPSFEDIDDDLTLTASTTEGEETTEAAVEDDDENEGDDDGINIQPSRTRGRGSFSRPGNTFTPVIRPLLGNRKPARFFRPTNLKVSTTVATRTRNSVKPTLIATPASSPVLNSPSFEISSRNLVSASLLNRGQSRFLSSGSFQSSGGAGSQSISPSSVLDRGSISFSATEAPEPTPSVVISPIKLRRPNPFRARLVELQAARLETLRQNNSNKNRGQVGTDEDPEDITEVEDETNSFPIPNLPSIPGGNAPIFVSSQRQTIVKRPRVEDTGSDIVLPEDIAARREKARERIKSLFSQRRPFGQSRRKRQVPFGAEFGSRTRERQSHILRRSQSYQPQYFLDQDNPPFTAFRQTQQEGNSNLYDYDFDTDTDNIYSSSSVRSSEASRNFRRQAPSVPEEQTSRSRSRFRSGSRFPSAAAAADTSATTTPRGRTRFRDPFSRPRPTDPPTTTTTTESSRFSRFRPRTPTSDSRSINSFSSNSNNRFTEARNRDSLFSQDSRSRFNSGSSSTAQRNSLFSRPKVVDYSDYDYYDYSDTDIQSSSEPVPDFITVTHQVPIATIIPVVEFGRTEFRDILSTSPSLEIVAVTELKSTDVSNSPVIYANAQTLTPRPGIQEIRFNALRATETTSVNYTPTRIRGRKTSFSHVVPTTIYNVETVTTQIVEPIDQNQLLNSLIQHLLLGQTNPSPTPPPHFNPAPVVQTPVTQLITHTSTYVTTVTEKTSTVLPITLRGIPITTTIVQSSTKVVTATEFSTETRVQEVAAPTQVLPQLAATQAPAINQQIASLLPALLGNPLFNAPQPSLLQQQQQQLLQQQALQEALLAQQREKQQQQLLLKQQQQEALNEQLLAEINLDDFTEEDLENLDIEAVLEAVAGKNPGLVFPNRNLFETAAPSSVAAGPKSSLVTIFKSGDNPGEFTSLVSTVFLTDDRRLKREVSVAPSQPVLILSTPLPVIDIAQGGPRGPLEVQLEDNIFIESSLGAHGPLVASSSGHYSWTESP